jgi:hypothetical protein
VKKLSGFLFLFLILFISNLPAQESSALSMSLNGATGLYTVPSGNLGWEGKSKVGIDAGGSYNFFSNNGIAKIGLSLFNWVELSGALDIQPREDDTNNIDGIIGAKIRLPTKRTAISIGGNLQLLNHRDQFSSAGQIYTAATYSGEFFTWPASTSLAIGYTIHEENKDNIDFGMGFDLVLFPSVFGRIVHWIIDYSNFSYSIQALGDDAWYRGCLNTGLRLDLSAIPALSKFKLVFDLAMLDIFDHERTVSMGLVVGVPITKRTK